MKNRFWTLLIPLLLLCSCGKTQSSSSTSSEVLTSEDVALKNKELLDKKAKEFENVANLCQYDFDPTSVKMDKRKNADGSDLTANDIRELTKTLTGTEETRTKNGQEIHLVYTFEGFYSEGYAGSYITYSGQAMLWEDGLSLFKSSNDVIGGIWWKENGKIHVDYPIDSNTIRQTESTSEDGIMYLQIPVYAGYDKASRLLKTLGGYYYPTVGIFIEDINLKHEVKADEAFYDEPIGADNCPVYRVDKSLKYYKLSKSNEERVIEHVPEWNYPHDDNYVASYKGMTATYNVKITPSDKKFTFDAHIDDKEFPFYSFDYLQYVEAINADDIAWPLYLDGSKLHTNLNATTNVLTVTLPDGSVHQTNVRFDSSEEINSLEPTYDIPGYTFVFKSPESLEITYEGQKETVSVKLTHSFGNYKRSTATIDETGHNHEGCLITDLQNSISLSKVGTLGTVLILRRANG